MELKDVIDRIESLNPRIQFHELISSRGDYVLFVGQMGEEDVPHYFAANGKYGVVEASCSTLKETDRMMAIVAGEDYSAPKKQVELPFDLN